MTQRYHIKVCGNGESLAGGELFPVLERLLPVRFSCGERNGTEPAGEIVVGLTPNKNTTASPHRASTLSIPPSAGPVDEGRQSAIEVKFSDDSEVPFPYRGRSMGTKWVRSGPVLSLLAHEKVLAASREGPLWTVSETGSVKHFRSVLPLPNISAEQNFSDAFNGERFLEILVLLQFVREIGARTAYPNPPLRAGFIIDDPNLHWPRYGFVDYRKIAAHAQKENYHVSFATIPFDTWFTHTATADLFRRNSRWLSLSIHGNNHAKKELALNYPPAMRRALLWQAVQRIERLERQANLRVCRVMVPPHGACSEPMLAELARCGFEAACISAGSLRAYNRDKPWTKTLGFFPSEIIEGCPVLPRWGLAGNIKNTVLTAAYLGQPLIFRGHHQDLREGMEVLDELAGFINSLGNVFWSNMTGLSRLNYLWQMEGTTCRVKPLGRKIAFQLPSDATEVIIEDCSAIDDGAWQAVSAEGSIRKIMLVGEQFLLSGGMDRKILLDRAALPDPDPARVGLKPTSAGLIMRRILTEARDRFFIS